MHGPFQSTSYYFSKIDIYKKEKEKKKSTSFQKRIKKKGGFLFHTICLFIYFYKLKSLFQFMKTQYLCVQEFFPKKKSTRPFIC